MDWILIGTPVLLIAGGAILFASVLLARRTSRDVEHRVQLVAVVPETPPDRKERKNHVKALTGPLDNYLRRIFTFGMKRSWGMKVNAIKLLAALLVASVGVWVLARTAFGLPFWASAPLALLAAFVVPRALLLHAQKKADARFNDLFPGTVDSIARMLRAGLPISTAVQSISTEAPPPVNLVFKTVADLTEIGTPIEDALDETSKQTDLADFRFFSVAVALQHATGGNLAATLEILSDIIRRRRAVRLKAVAATAEIRVSAYVIGSLPLLVVGALLMLQPGYLAPLFHDPRGHIVIGMAVGLLLLTGFTMRQMMRSVSG
ncbi:MAG TPA: type II secretion system F family protein [Pseudolabrys sp.]|nr:type II secretion system F family protein [Pseudolabrys sp.]